MSSLNDDDDDNCHFVVLYWAVMCSAKPPKSYLLANFIRPNWYINKLVFCIIIYAIPYSFLTGNQPVAVTREKVW